MKDHHVRSASGAHETGVEGEECMLGLVLRKMTHVCSRELPLSKVHLHVLDFSYVDADPTELITSYETLFRSWLQNDLLSYVFYKLLRIHLRQYGLTRMLLFALVLLLVANSLYGKMSCGPCTFKLDTASTCVVLNHLRVQIRMYEQEYIPTATLSRRGGPATSVGTGAGVENMSFTCASPSSSDVTFLKSFRAYVHEGRITLDNRGLRELFLYGYIGQKLRRRLPTPPMVRDADPEGCCYKSTSLHQEVIRLRSKLPDGSFETAFYISSLLGAYMDETFHVHLQFPRYEVTLHDFLEKHRSAKVAPTGPVAHAVVAGRESAEHVYLSWCSQLCFAVKVLHRLGITHFDIKTNNIMLTGSARNIVLIDYDSAMYGPVRSIRHTVDVRTTLTTRPPEQWIPWDGGVGTSVHADAAEEVVDARPEGLQDYRPSDMWSLALVLYSILLPEFFWTLHATWNLYHRVGVWRWQGGQYLGMGHGDGNLKDPEGLEVGPPSTTSTSTRRVNRDFPERQVYMHVYDSLRSLVHRERARVFGSRLQGGGGSELTSTSDLKSSSSSGCPGRSGNVGLCGVVSVRLRPFLRSLRTTVWSWVWVGVAKSIRKFRALASASEDVCVDCNCAPSCDGHPPRLRALRSYSRELLGRLDQCLELDPRHRPTADALLKVILGEIDARRK